MFCPCQLNPISQLHLKTTQILMFKSLSRFSKFDKLTLANIFHKLLRWALFLSRKHFCANFFPIFLVQVWIWTVRIFILESF